MSNPERRARFEAVVAEGYEPLQRYLRRRCPRDDVDDVLSDVLLVIWRRVDDAPAVPLPWCYGIARRCLANHRRSSARRLRLVRRIERTSTGLDHAWVPPADAALHDALGGLGELDREVIRLWAWERLEPREIAEVLGTTANAVSLRLTRLRRRLEFELARQDGVGAGHIRPVGPEEVTP